MSSLTSIVTEEGVLTTPIADYEYISSQDSNDRLDDAAQCESRVQSVLAGKVQHFIPPSQLLSSPFLAKMHSLQTFRYPFFLYSNLMQGALEALTAVLGVLQSPWSGSDEDVLGLLEYNGLKRPRCGSGAVREFVQATSDKWVADSAPAFDSRPVSHFSIYRYMYWMQRDPDVRYSYITKFAEVMDGVDSLDRSLGQKGNKFLQEEYIGYLNIKKLHTYCADQLHDQAAERTEEGEAPSQELLATLESSEEYHDAVSNAVVGFLESSEASSAQLALQRPYSAGAVAGELITDVLGSDVVIALGNKQMGDCVVNPFGALIGLLTADLPPKIHALRSVFQSNAVSECGVYDCVDTAYGVHSTQWIGDQCGAFNAFLTELAAVHGIMFTPLDAVVFHISIFRLVVQAAVTALYSPVESEKPGVPGGLLVLLTDLDHDAVVMLSQRQVDLSCSFVLLLADQLRRVRRAAYLYHQCSMTAVPTQGCAYIKSNTSPLFAPMQVITVGSFLLTDCPDVMCQQQYLQPTLVSDSYLYDSVLDVYLGISDHTERRSFLDQLMQIPIRSVQPTNDENPSSQDYMLPAVTPIHDLLTSQSCLNGQSMAVAVGPLGSRFYHQSVSIDALLRDTAFASSRKGSFQLQAQLKAGSSALKASAELIDLNTVHTEHYYTVGTRTMSSFYTQPVRPLPILTPTCLSKSMEVALLNYWFSDTTHEQQLEVSTYLNGLAHAYYPLFLSESLVPSSLTDFVREAYDRATHCVQLQRTKQSPRTLECLMDYGNTGLWRYKHPTDPEPVVSTSNNIAAEVSLTTFGSPRALKPADQRRRTPSRARGLLAESPRRGLTTSSNININPNNLTYTSASSFIIDEQYVSHALLNHPATVQPCVYYYTMLANLNNNIPSTTDEEYYKDVSDTLLYNPYKVHHAEQPNQFTPRHQFPRMLPLLTKVQQKLRSTGLVFAPSDILYDSLALLPTRLQREPNMSPPEDYYRSLDMSMHLMDISTEDASIEHESHSSGNIFRTANQLQIMLGTPIAPTISRHRTQRPRFTHLKEEEQYMGHLIGGGGQGKHRTDDFKFVACSSLVQDVLTDLIDQNENEMEMHFDQNEGDNYEYVYQDSQ